MTNSLLACALDETVTMAILISSQKLDSCDRGAALVTCTYRNGLALVVALLLSVGCASHTPRASEPQTQSPPPSIKQDTGMSSRRGQQGGEQAQQSAQSPQEESGRPAAGATEGVAQAGNAHTYRQRAQQQAPGSDGPRAAQRDWHVTKNGESSKQDTGWAAAHNASIPIYSGGQTEEEHRQGLDRNLNRSLAKFDERLRGEQAELDEKTARAAAQRAAEGGGGDIAIRRQEGLERAFAPPPPEMADGGGDQPDLAYGKPIPDEGDDDVVARQLREAAQSEQDPELRKKLWEEYREYKENSG
jgi:hypothetical protein